MLATGSQDTSGTNRVITTSGSAMTFLNDTTYGIPFGKFTGSGGLRVNTGWSSASNDFTVSFWMQNNTGSFLTGAIILTGAVKDTLYDTTMVYTTYTDSLIHNTNLAQNIFTSGEGGSIKMILDATGKCSIRGGAGEFSSSVTVSRLNKYNAWTNGTYTTRKIAETGNNMQETFNCTSLLDNKWHNIVISSRLSSTSIYIDGIEIAKLTGAIPIGRYVTIGSSDTNTLAYSGKILPAQITSVVNSKFLRGNLAAFRLYSRALTIDELESIFDEFRYAQSDLIGAGSIEVNMERYTKPNLYAIFKNIPLSLSKNSVTYEYSTDGITYTPISDITDTSTSTGSISYRMGVDLSAKPDGKITVIYRVRASNSTFQNIGTISFIKMDIVTGIIINMPNSDMANSKTITAEAPGSELKMLITTSTICDASIGSGSFENYSDLVFTSKSDNGKRVCYKATYPNINKVVYRISSSIQGIIGISTVNSLFADYTFWPSSTYSKSNDSTYMILELLNLSKQRTDSFSYQGYGAGWSLSSSNPITMTDINGDGLVDFLYSQSDPMRRAIIINNGNFTFRAVYKCAIDGTIYYGDCADTTR
ncbi:hypothetical protein KBC86_03220 [Candidatus Gracilibacteria bacterium]|nr:hypothetical protein [Candidatus Gracilibacteria bacterium]